MTDSEDDYVTYGTALDPLDEENLPRKKPITIEEQVAVDDQGRRRFHGAFTGGFSAGYFNTVGTRDGWRPQQFKSTRSSKADNVLQKPEDFMDEEDTGEFGIAPTAIRATKGYTDQNQKGKKRERSKQDSTGPIPGTPVLHELLKPVRERVGAMLLKKMGWKPGQGVGPRLTKKEKKRVQKQREKIKIYGCSLPNQQEKGSESESDDSDDEFANITFAPDDYEPFRCNPKDNYFGIGYSGLDRQSVLGGHINLFEAPTFSVQEKNKKLSIRGQAFGVGAFEAEDEDIYAKEDMSNYDFTLGPERKSKTRWSEEKKPKSNCIKGFLPAKEQFPQKKVFPVPVIPKDFQPFHKVRKSRFAPLVEEPKDRHKRIEMNAQSRAIIINDDRPSIIDSKTVEPKSNSPAVNIITRTLNLYGKEQTAERLKQEQSLPKKTGSWLDKLSYTTFVKGETLGIDPKIKGNLQSTSSFASSEPEKTEATESEKSLSRPSFADLDKQRRFEQYLKFSESERKLKFSSVQPLSMSDWEREREAEEFETAAKICEKLDNETSTKSEKKVEEKIDLQSLTGDERMMSAAKMKMFGSLTRTSVEWRPAKLVCTRFNVAEPFVGVAIEDDKHKKKKFSIFDNMSWNEMSRFDTGKKLEHDVPNSTVTASSSFTEKEPHREFDKRSTRDNETKTAPDDSKSQTISEKRRSFEDSYDKVFGHSSESSKDKAKASDLEPESDSKVAEEPIAKMNTQEKKDLFKSIFLSSSDESEPEEESTQQPDEEKLKAALIGKNAAEQNVQRNTSPPRGIFAKLDFDSLFKRPEKTKEREDLVNTSADETSGKSDTVFTTKDEREAEVLEEEQPMDIYGPALPTALPQTSDATSLRHIFTGGSKKTEDKDDSKWVEKSSKKKSKKEKKKHKHKERSRSKSRKKSKKEKRH